MITRDFLFVVGARPNFIKIAPICQVLKSKPNLSFSIVHTGQHYDKKMSDVFFDELNIPAPDFNLNIGSGSHGVQTGKMMIELEKLCLENTFKAIVVIGDVNSTLAGAIVGAKLNIPVIHIESGLRSYNRAMPEEINRIATDHVSNLLFAPTQLAMDNLDAEGLGDRAFYSGDVMYDTILNGLVRAKEKSQILQELEIQPEAYYLATLHRPYNVDSKDQLSQIFAGYQQLERKIILSAHPRLRKNLDQFDIQIADNIQITPPLGYLDFILLQNHSIKVITDSGGVQKEAFFLKRPCVTLRPETEWVETVNAQANTLVKDRSAKNIVEAVLDSPAADFDQKPYGEGNASQIIIELSEQNLF